jgi:hypothetical protein
MLVQLIININIHNRHLHSNKIFTPRDLQLFHSNLLDCVVSQVRFIPKAVSLIHPCGALVVRLLPGWPGRARGLKDGYCHGERGGGWEGIKLKRQRARGPTSSGLEVDLRLDHVVFYFSEFFSWTCKNPDASTLEIKENSLPICV